MKRTLALLLAIIMIFTLAACGNNTADVTDGDTTANTESSTSGTEGTTGNTENPDETTSSTEGTEESTTTTQGTKPTEPSHKHSYNGKVTKNATCTEDGYTKYTCACGDTYTETQTATGHSMGGWKYHTVGSMYTVGERRNSCANCSHYESEMQYDAFFQDYMETAYRLGVFSSVDALTIDSVIQAIVNNVSYEDIGVNDRGHGCIAFKMDDVNKYTSNRLGRTYDYTNMGYIPTEAGGCTYDAETNTLVEERYEGGGCQKEYVGYTTTDNVHFVVTYNIDGATYTSNIELIGGKYIITSQTITWG